jgi:DNA-binding FrmR family transcriptional regulator
MANRSTPATAVAGAPSPHALRDADQVRAISTRLKRAQGQLGAVVRMIDEGRSCDEIVTQIAAVSKAVNTAAFTMITSSLRECLTDPSVESDELAQRLQKLFLSLA